MNMNICIIGAGAAGLMAANYFAVKDYITSVTVIGSKKIPTIGVGESTTLNFLNLHNEYDNNIENFIRNTDATVKLGVMYRNWGLENADFLNFFKNSDYFKHNNLQTIEGYCHRLANKDKGIFIHDILGTELFYNALQNNIPTLEEGYDPILPSSWHFDANKFIRYLISILEERDKASIIESTVTECKFKEDGVIDSVTLEGGEVIKSDFYIIATGNNVVTNEIFNFKYKFFSTSIK